VLDSRSFDERVEVIEQACRDVLEFPDYQHLWVPGFDVSFARRYLTLLKLARSAKRRGDVDLAASAAIEAGYLYATVATMTAKRKRKDQLRGVRGEALEQRASNQTARDDSFGLLWQETRRAHQKWSRLRLATFLLEHPHEDHPDLLKATTGRHRGAPMKPESVESWAARLKLK
jgi:hypothetical protein